MAPAHSRIRSLEPLPSGHILRLGTDLGTGKIQIDGQHVQGTATRHVAEIIPICLEGDQTARIAQISIYPEHGSVIYGTVAVEEAVAADPTLQDKVLKLWKLALHPEFHRLEEVAHVLGTVYAQHEEHKDRGAIQEFMEDQLRGMIRDICEFYKSSNRNAGKDASYWDRIPVELQISVPAMWDDQQRGVVFSAAYNALDKSHPDNKVEVRDEPLCVATRYILDLVNSGSIRVGQCILLIDCGKGTLDIATVRLVRAPTDDVLMQLQCVGSCSGSSAGSHTINTLAWKWLESGDCEEVQNLDGTGGRCEQLGISRREFLRQFSKEIDRVKHETYNTPRDAFITIRSGHGGSGNGRIPRLTIELRSGVIQTWYKTWADSVTQLVKNHLDMQGTTQYRCASLTGGGCLATVIKSAIKDVLAQDPYNIEIGTATACISPCSQGALLQHFFEEHKLPPVANFYLALNEEYQRDIHKGVATQKSKYKSRTDIVEDRLHRIMRYEGGKFSGAARTPIQFLVEDDDVADRFHVEVHYSEQDLEDHSALRTEDGALRPGIRSYPLIFVDLETLSEYGFKAKGSAASGKRHFDVRTYVQMHGSDDNLEITIEVMENHNRFLHERYGQPYSENDVLWTFTRRLWNKSMSHFVRDVTGTAGSAGPVEGAAPAASTDATAAATPANSSTPPNPSVKRKADDSSKSLRKKKTPKRTSRNHNIDYSEDRYEE